MTPPDSYTLRAQAARANELMAPYKKWVELLDPTTAPDRWTREALAIQALAVLQRKCPACGGEHIPAGDRTIIDHDPPAPATRPTSAPTPPSTASTSTGSTASSTASATTASSTRCSSSVRSNARHQRARVA
jgi:hypothetical protein